MDNETVFALSIPPVGAHRLLSQSKCALEKRRCKLKMPRVGLSKPALSYAGSASCVYSHNSELRISRVANAQRFDQLEASLRVNKRFRISSQINEQVTKNDMRLRKQKRNRILVPRRAKALFSVKNGLIHAREGIRNASPNFFRRCGSHVGRGRCSKRVHVVRFSGNPILAQMDRLIRPSGSFLRIVLVLIP